MWRNRSKTVKVLIIAVTLALLAAGGWFGYSRWSGEATADIAAGPAASSLPTFHATDHTVELRVPDGAMAPNTQVTFAPLDVDVTTDLNQTARGIIAASTPVDIQVIQGSLAPQKVSVTLTYDPARIPSGLTDKQVGMVVFDPNLNSWVPILGATVDAAKHTVTGLGPHFSWYSAVVLDPLKAVVDVAGKAVKTVIDAHTTVASWFVQLTRDLATTLVTDLFGIPPKLTCDSTSKDVTVTAKSLLNGLDACAQPGADKDVTVRLRNGYAFPMRTDKLPSGTALRTTDIWNNSADLADLVRNLFWSTQNQAVLSRTAIGSMTVTPELKAPATLAMDLDGTAVPFDLAIAVLMVIAPGTAAARAIKTSAKAAVKGGAITGKSRDASSWVKHTYDTLDCVAQAVHTLQAGDIFGKESIHAQANIVHGCLSVTLDTINLKSALLEMIGVVKVLPEMVETVLYPLGASLGEQLGVYRQQKPTVTMQRRQTSSPVTQTDFTDVLLPPGPCGSTKSVQLYAGTATVPTKDGPYILEYLTDAPRLRADVDGDGAQNALITVGCTPEGGNATSAEVLVLAGTDTGALRLIGILTPQKGAPGTFAAAVDRLSFANGALTVSELTYAPDDAHCCPTNAATTVWTWRGGRFIVSR